MIQFIILKGAPASGKSYFAKSLIDQNIENYVRINNDTLRQSLHNGHYSVNNEKMIKSTRTFLIKEALKHHKNIILDNINANKDIWKEAVVLCKESNEDIHLYEKPFYQELSVLLERDAKREGSACVGPEVVKRWWIKLGKEQFKNYLGKEQYFTKQDKIINDVIVPAYNEALPNAIISDLDGTLAKINDRSPYDATDCDIKDLPNWPIIKTIKLYYNANYEIIFVSGRQDKYKAETIRFIEKYLPNIKYQLFMRSSNDYRKDVVIKKEIYENFIKNKFNIEFIMDDRNSVVQFWRSVGLTCFQVADGNF